MRFRPSLWLTVSGAVAFAILCGLGYWQLERRAWKNGLIEQVEARMDNAAVPLPDRIGDPDAWRFRRVSVSGVFHHDGEVYRTGKAEGGVIGYRVFTPLERPDGSMILVERGWVPERFKDPAARPDEPPAGPVSFTGVLRLPDETGLFTPAPDAASLTWFAVDPAAMAASSGRQVPDWYVAAEQGHGAWPRAERPDLRMRNEHLNYALTWFSLAAVLLVIWVIIGFRRGQESAR